MPEVIGSAVWFPFASNVMPALFNRFVTGSTLELHDGAPPVPVFEVILPKPS
jgi:hypothetical protein